MQLDIESEEPRSLNELIESENISSDHPFQ